MHYLHASAVRLNAYWRCLNLIQSKWKKKARFVGFGGKIFESVAANVLGFVNHGQLVLLTFLEANFQDTRRSVTPRRESGQACASY
jgi:hypothetical protein